MNEETTPMNYAAVEERAVAIMMGTKVIDGVPMMSHLQIAQLTEKRPDNVKRTMDNLRNELLIPSITQIEEPTPGGGKRREVYYVNERDSHVVVAEISSAYMAFLVDFWFAHREKVQVKPLTREQQIANALLLSQEIIAEKDEKIALLETKIEEDAPLVDYAKDIADSKGCMSLTATAKSFGVRPNKFIEFLKQTGRIYKQDGVNLPIQGYVNSGVFKVRTYAHPGGLTTQTLVTGKGQDILRQLVRKHQAIGQYSHLI